jgi:hypothetical protein
MIRVITIATDKTVRLQCDRCSEYFVHVLPTIFNLANMRQARVLRRAALKRGWSWADERDACPTCGAENKKAGAPP